MKVVYASVDDWVGLYIDGELEQEGHNISAYLALAIVMDKGEPVEELLSGIVDWDWIMNNGGRLPQKVWEIEWEEEPQ